MSNSGDDVVDCLEKWGQQQYSSFFFMGFIFICCNLLDEPCSLCINPIFMNDS